jgi:addiction module HigA family antidote
MITMAGLDEAMTQKRARGQISEHLPALREGMANADIDVSVTASARALHVSRPTLSNLNNGHAGVSPEMAVRLSKAVSSTPGFWMRLQTNDDLAQIERRADTIEVSPLVKAHMA